MVLFTTIRDVERNKERNSMRYLIVAMLIVCNGCKHLPKQETTRLELIKPKVEEKKDDKEKTRNISIQFFPIQSLTVKVI